MLPTPHPTEGGDLMATVAETLELMPVISMWQPYASLLFTWDSERGDFAKCNETRGFKLPERLIGKPIAIHATQKFAPESSMTPALADLCYDVFGCGYNFSLPRGAIIGIVAFDRAIPTADIRAQQPTTERAAGDWTDGRFAWPVLSCERLAVPVAAKGKQGWWRYPTAALRAAAAKAREVQS